MSFTRKPSIMWGSSGLENRNNTAIPLKQLANKLKVESQADINEILWEKIAISPEEFEQIINDENFLQLPKMRQYELKKYLWNLKNAYIESTLITNKTQEADRNFSITQADVFHETMKSQVQSIQKIIDDHKKTIENHLENSEIALQSWDFDVAFEQANIARNMAYPFATWSTKNLYKVLSKIWLSKVWVWQEEDYSNQVFNQLMQANSKHVLSTWPLFARYFWKADQIRSAANKRFKKINSDNKLLAETIADKSYKHRILRKQSQDDIAGNFLAWPENTIESQDTSDIDGDDVVTSPVHLDTNNTPVQEQSENKKWRFRTKTKWFLSSAKEKIKQAYGRTKNKVVKWFTKLNDWRKWLWDKMGNGIKNAWNKVFSKKSIAPLAATTTAINNTDNNDTQKNTSPDTSRTSENTEKNNTKKWWFSGWNRPSLSKLKMSPKLAYTGTMVATGAQAVVVVPARVVAKIAHMVARPQSIFSWDMRVDVVKNTWRWIANFGRWFTGIFYKPHRTQLKYENVFKDYGKWRWPSSIDPKNWVLAEMATLWLWWFGKIPKLVANGVEWVANFVADTATGKFDYNSTAYAFKKMIAWDYK